MQKLFKDIMTGEDNESYDSGRVLCLVSFVVFFILAGICAFEKEAWRATDFAGGISMMAVGFGANLNLKKSTEPKAKDMNNEK